MWRSSGSTPNPSRTNKLLTLSLSTLWRKLIPAACIQNLDLSVTLHSLWPLVRVETRTRTRAPTGGHTKCQLIFLNGAIWNNCKYYHRQHLQYIFFVHSRIECGKVKCEVASFTCSFEIYCLKTAHWINTESLFLIALCHWNSIFWFADFIANTL